MDAAPWSSASTVLQPRTASATSAVGELEAAILTDQRPAEAVHCMLGTALPPHGRVRATGAAPGCAGAVNALRRALHLAALGAAGAQAAWEAWRKQLCMAVLTRGAASALLERILSMRARMLADTPGTALSSPPEAWMSCLHGRASSIGQRAAGGGVCTPVRSAARSVHPGAPGPAVAAAAHHQHLSRPSSAPQHLLCNPHPRSPLAAPLRAAAGSPSSASSSNSSNGCVIARALAHSEQQKHTIRQRLRRLLAPRARISVLFAAPSPPRARMPTTL